MQLHHLVTVNTTVQMLNLALVTCVPVVPATRYLKLTPIIARTSMNVPYLENVVRNVKISKADSSVPVMMGTN